MYPNIQKGFIALISISSIAVLLLILCVSLSARSFFTRTFILSYENKTHSEERARECAAYILQKLAEDAQYRGGETTTINGSSCTVTTSSGGDPRSFTLTATHHHSHTTWNITITLASLDVIRRYELP